MNQKILLSIVLLVLVTGYFGWLDQPGLRAEEPRRAMVSIEMMKSGNLIVPQLLGWTYYNKPPLFQWVMIFFFWLFGNISEWVVRLPSTVALFAVALVNWRFVRNYFSNRTALLSSLFLLTSADIFYYGGINAGEIDLFYTFLVYLNIIAIFYFLEKEKYLLMFLFSYFFAALGFLTKGPPSILFQGLTLIGGLIYFRQWKRIVHWQHILGILIFLILAGGYLLLLNRSGELEGFIIRQLKESSQRTAFDSNIWGAVIGIFKNPLALLVNILPWSVWLIALIMKPIRKQMGRNRLLVFIFLFVAVNFPVYWISGELRLRYTYPFFPFLCIILAVLFENVPKAYPVIRKIWELLFFGLIAGFPIILLVGYFIPALNLQATNPWINGLLIGAGIGLFAFYLKSANQRVFAIFIFLGLIRIGVNNIYLPQYDAESETTKLKNHVEKMIDLATGEPLAIAGTPYVYNSTIEFLGKEYLTGEVTVPLILSYQIPYYYVLKTGTVLKHNPDPKSGEFYLVIDYDLDRFPGTILYQFRDFANQHDMFLVRLHQE
jgi:4-amino-4-deoxy-L-arabinose transferase-like glycosyltransferase